MAEEDKRVRVLQSLRGKICEAKNLGPVSGPNRQRDLCTFCTISLDQEEVFRTKVFDKSVSPFYGEDFYFEIPRPFQCLSFYIYAKSVFQRELPVGKVSIQKDELCKFSGRELWCGLHPVDANSEVQGKVHLEMRLNEVITVSGSMGQQLLVRIIECQGLPLISGQNCDPYATVSLVGPARCDQKKTKVKKKTSNPHFEETFSFEVTRLGSYTKKSHFQVEEEDIEKLEIKVDLWNNESLAQDVFLGETRVPVKVLRNAHIHKAWYLLQPKGTSSRPRCEELGSLRLKLTYIQDTVLPPGCYTALCSLLLRSPDVKPISASAAHILGEVCGGRSEAVQPTARLLLQSQRLLPYVCAVAELELDHTQEVNTIFRGNSLATRCIDDMMKIVGKNYLTVILKPVIDESRVPMYYWTPAPIAGPQLLLRDPAPQPALMMCFLSADACASLAVYQGPQRDQEDYSKFTIQEPKETFQTLKQLRNIMEDLQKQHRVRSDSTAQYGSLDNPIVGKCS
ncbi:ras GTPase-activating protein 2-like [Pseudoliparis swirei]|uniref:ras GTPase-activating protein 2-like n=1 Tax=Pseudoliparis swirei TaxID=2059687 RepID=UPI0024BDDF84|nr:ras GTPase-activating protein 2-like [Pseudoliparis swirei]